MRDEITVGEWVEAMQSGKYAQIQGRLRSETDGEFCALGVLHEELGLLQTDKFGDRAIRHSMHDIGIDPRTIANINDREDIRHIKSKLFKRYRYKKVVEYIKNNACADDVIKVDARRRFL